MYDFITEAPTRSNGRLWCPGDGIDDLNIESYFEQNRDPEEDEYERENFEEYLEEEYLEETQIVNSTRKDKAMSKNERKWIDIKGDEVPARYVSKFDKERDRVCRKIEQRFRAERARLQQLVKACLADLDGLMKLKTSLGERGNFQTSSFDGLIQVSIDQQYNVVLDERVVRARELMLDYVNDELAKAGENKLVVVRKLIEGAFRANSLGFLPVSKIFELMRMEVPDARWSEARQILQDAIKPVPGKRYLNCRVRKSLQHDFETIRLDVATCWPEN